MDPEPPPLHQSPPPLPPAAYRATPPPPPLWPAPAPEAPHDSHVARWTLAVLALLAVATAGVFIFVGRHPVLPAPGPYSTPDATSTPSATPWPAAIAQAAKQYLAAVVSVNADGDRFHAALAADAALPCSCSPGEFAIRADTLDQIPALNRDIENLQGVLQSIKHEVPDIAADINTVVMDNQQYMYWLAAAYRSSEQPGAANVGSDISTGVALDTASGPDFVRLRADLGLPPPPSG